jgi:steroid delta-isomerase
MAGAVAHTVAAIRGIDDAPNGESMPTAAQIRECLLHYAERLSAGDVDAIAALYHEEGSIEDPVGSPAHHGREAVRRFYASTAGALSVEISGPICCAANAGVMPLLARLALPGQPVRYLDAIDLVEFDDSGLIRSLRAYWNPAEMRDGPETAARRAIGRD